MDGGNANNDDNTVSYNVFRYEKYKKNDCRTLIVNKVREGSIAL